MWEGDNRNPDAFFQHGKRNSIPIAVLFNPKILIIERAPKFLESLGMLVFLLDFHITNGLIDHGDGKVSEENSLNILLVALLTSGCTHNQSAKLVLTSVIRSYIACFALVGLYSSR
jgi:hypothetical protein